MESENHFVKRSGWLRASVLGANDGILSTTSLAIGVAAASVARDPIILATLAGLVAGALSMAAGEYVSVSSQLDVETADLKREKNELASTPEIELDELSKIYEKRGLTSDLAIEVAKQLTAHNALEAHARDELGLNEISRAKPLQAAFASAASFLVGGILPLIDFNFCSIKSNDILPIWVLNFISCFIRNYCSKGWGFDNHKIGIENLYMGNHCNGNVSIDWISVWS